MKKLLNIIDILLKKGYVSFIDIEAEDYDSSIVFILQTSYSFRIVKNLLRFYKAKNFLYNFNKLIIKKATGKYVKFKVIDQTRFELISTSDKLETIFDKINIDNFIEE